MISQIAIVSPLCSIHNLTRRSTIPCRRLHQCGASFNSRPHKEVDSKHSQYFFIFASIIYSFIQIILLFLIFLFKISSHFTYYPLYTRCESPDIFCPLRIRTKGSTSQSHQNWVLFQYALLCFYIYLPDYKIADCPIPCL